MSDDLRYWQRKKREELKDEVTFLRAEKKILLAWAELNNVKINKLLSRVKHTIHKRRVRQKERLQRADISPRI